MIINMNKKRIYYIENNVQIFLPETSYRIIVPSKIPKESVYKFDMWLHINNLAARGVYKLKGFKSPNRKPLFVIIVSRKHSKTYYLES